MGKKPGEGEGAGRGQGTRDFRVRFSLCNLELSNEILMEKLSSAEGGGGGWRVIGGEEVSPVGQASWKRRGNSQGDW